MEVKYPVRKETRVVGINAYAPRGAWVTEDSFGGDIDVSNGWEVGWWAEALGCSRQQLCEAVKLVGNDAAEVRKYLKDQEYAQFLQSFAALIREAH
jgi:hypothetical protein